MGEAMIVARVVSGDRLECTVTSSAGKTLVLTGSVTDLEPQAKGAASFGNSHALISNAWAHALLQYESVSLSTPEEQKFAAKRAKQHRAVAQYIAEVADDLTDESRLGWCSACFDRSQHRKARLPRGHVPAYLCAACGSLTLPCAGPGCENMAVRKRGALRVPQYCAEHRHEIPGFAKADHRLLDLGDYREFLEYDKPNLRRRTKVAGTAIAAIPLAAGAAFAAAPAIGGAIGTMLGSGLSGAAATSYGLALVGGGSIASGGLGMAGGTAVIAALGGAMGGAMSASVTNAYVREDKSFHVERLREGPGVPVIVCNGFLSENGTGWGDWKDLVTERYPDSPVFRVHWGAKELKDLGFLAGGGAGKAVARAGLNGAAAKAGKVAAKKLGPLSLATWAADLAKNPWNVAKNRADKTGVVVADLLARTNADSYVLIGHSLGARAMVVATQTLGTKRSGPRVRALHLLGVAIGAKSDWTSLTTGVDDAVFNYHSTGDDVLKLVYKAVQGGQTAAGLSGFRWNDEKLQNIDVSAQVDRHSGYFSGVSLK